jgi:hypothetical protein
MDISTHLIKINSVIALTSRFSNTARWKFPSLGPKSSHGWWLISGENVMVNTGFHRDFEPTTMGI